MMSKQATTAQTTQSKKGMIFAGLFVVVGALWFFWPRPGAEAPPPTPPPLEQPVVLETTPTPTPTPKPSLEQVMEAPAKDKAMTVTKKKAPVVSDYPEEDVTEDERLDRAKVRAQMKAALTAVYSAQQSFHAEFGRYTTDLKLSGWDFEGSQLNFKIGFLSPGVVGGEFQNEDPREMDSDAYIERTRSENPESAKTYSERAEGLNLQSFSSACKHSCTADSQRFELMVVSRTGPNGTPEVWIINEKKELRQVQTDE